MNPFKLERYFEKWEFQAPYLLCSSDNETLPVKDLLALADEESLDLWENLDLGYTHVTGHPMLKKEIAQLYSQVDENGICTFAGAGEGIYAVLSLLVNKGDHVLAPFPCYQSLRDLPRSKGAEVSLYPIRETSEGWRFELEDLIQVLRPDTCLIILNFPHNPTGAHIERETLEQIVAYARRSHAYIFSDEVYRFSEHEGPATPPAADLYERAISLGVMSKSFGLAGLRVGWLATQDKAILEQCMNFKCYMSLCNSAPSEILALMALRAKEKILDRNLAIIRKNLDILDTFFSAYRDMFSWKRPKAGSTTFPKLLAQRSIEDFSQELIAKAGVLLLPGSVYDYPGNHFRLGFGRENLPVALGHLERFLKDYR
ncbi:MAG: aminotransferase class I/II-fold pyridoxal phosphate-dependent enzyme [Parachlamydia sp.]|nr:aminotransferase class I/II-fold pyridoxal phosphate-dependent enzyme [Parachlamydia sp.]